MLGYNPGELAGNIKLHTIAQTWMDGELYPGGHRTLAELLKTNLSYEQEQEGIFWRQDGSSFLVKYRMTALYDNGEHKGAVVVFRDITEEKAVERAKESAEKADRAKSEFLAIMSHEPAYADEWNYRDGRSPVGNRAYGGTAILHPNYQ